MSASYDPLDCGTIWQSIKGTDMKRVNQMRLYRLGNLTRFRSLRAGDKIRGSLEWFGYAILQLRVFVRNEEYQKMLPFSVDKAKNLNDFINEVTDESLDKKAIASIDSLLSAFETSLDDELQRLHTYQVDEVGAYSFDRLIGAADTVFPDEQRKNGLIPEQVKTDFRSAGRCLAFDLPTSCGFHAFRATDAMLRAYCNHFGAHPKGNGRDWGRYIAALRDALKNTGPIKKPNERTVELLDSIRATDRNPLVHPELNLDPDGALLIFDLCKNAISLMATDIKNSI